MAGSQRHDPYRGFKFKVVIDGFTKAGFQKVSGLKEATEVTDYREGTDAVTPRKLPGLTSYDNVTLEHGLSNNQDFRKWRQQIVNLGKEAGAAGDGPAGTAPPLEFRKTVVISLFDKGGNEVKQYELLEAWPASLEIGDLDAMSSDVVIESLELTHEGLKENAVGG
jgi:phage tail-like protein